MARPKGIFFFFTFKKSTARKSAQCSRYTVAVICFYIFHKQNVHQYDNYSYKTLTDFFGLLFFKSLAFSKSATFESHLTKLFGPWFLLLWGFSWIVTNTQVEFGWFGTKCCRFLDWKIEMRWIFQRFHLHVFLLNHMLYRVNYKPGEMAGALVSVCQCVALIGSHLASYPGYQPHLQRFSVCPCLACFVLFCFGDILRTRLFMTHAQLIFVS